MPTLLQSAAVMMHGARVLGILFHLGLLGLLLVSVVDASFIPLPLPGLTDIMVVGYAASHANVILLVTIATLGSAGGGYFSYVVGHAGGKAFLEKHINAKLLASVTGWMERNAMLSVALPAILPPPVPLSPFVLAAGASHMSLRRFMTAFTLSRLLRHCIAAWLGVRYGEAVLGLWHGISQRYGVSILAVFWTVVLVPTVIGIWRLWRVSHQLEIKPTLPLPGRRDAAA